MLRLLKERGYIAGISARGLGLTEIGLEIPKGSDDYYLNYLKENQEKIKEYFDAGTITV